MRYPQERGDRQVSPGLLHQAVACVDQHHGQLSGRGAGDGVAGVLNMPWAVSQHELTGRSGEIPVCHVDGDALLPLGPQPIGEQRQIQRVSATSLGCPGHGGELVGQDRLGVMQQPTDQRGLAVVDGAGGRQPQQPSHQK
jgi:hypothetical protein